MCCYKRHRSIFRIFSSRTEPVAPRREARMSASSARHSICLGWTCTVYIYKTRGSLLHCSRKNCSLNWLFFQVPYLSRLIYPPIFFQSIGNGQFVDTPKNCIALYAGICSSFLESAYIIEKVRGNQYFVAIMLSAMIELMRIRWFFLNRRTSGLQYTL